MVPKMLPSKFNNDNDKNGHDRWIPIRHLILISALLSFTLISANTTAFSVTVICMTRTPIPGNDLINGTSNHHFYNETDDAFKYPFTITEQNAFFSAAALGSIISGLAITNMIEHFGLRAVLSAYGLLSALCCFLIPLAAPLGFWPLFMARVLQGSVGPAQYVMIGTISRDWAPLASTGAYLMILSSHFQLGRVLSMPTAAAFCMSPMGWPGVYVLFGTLTFLSFGTFFFLFRDHPKEHRSVSVRELAKITRGKYHHHHHHMESEELALFSTENGPKNQQKRSKHEKSNKEVIPYGKILGDPVVWVVLLTYWSDEVGFEMLGQFGPIYLNRVLDIDLGHTGFWSAMPYVLAIGVKVFAGSLYKRMPCANERTRINIFTAISQLGMALCFLLLSILPSIPKIPLLAVQIAYTSVNVFCGLDFLGVVKCSQRISQQFSHVIMAWNSIISSVTVLLLPVVVTLFAPQNSVAEWSRIFGGIGSAELFMILLFFVFCDTEPRSWTKRRQNLAIKAIKTEEESKADDI